MARKHRGKTRSGFCKSAQIGLGAILVTPLRTGRCGRDARTVHGIPGSGIFGSFRRKEPAGHGDRRCHGRRFHWTSSPKLHF